MSTAREDPTGRTRLRDTAMECFAAHRFDESLRAISARAKASAYLVRHHFGSKEALRAACHATVLTRYSTLKNQSPPAVPRQLYALLPSARPGGSCWSESFARSATAGTGDHRPPPQRGGTRALPHPAVDRCQGGQLRDGSRGAVGRLRRVMESYCAQTVLPTPEMYTEGLFTNRDYLDEYLAFRAGTRNPPAGPAGETVER